MAKERTYIANHTIGKPKKEATLPGVWNPGDEIKETELGEHVQSLLRREAIRPADGSTVVVDAGPSQDLLAQLKAQGRVIEDMKRKLHETEEANEALATEVERLNKAAAPPKPVEA